MFVRKNLYPTRDIKREAIAAAESPAPAAGTDYPFVQQVRIDTDAHIADHDPFQEEKENAARLSIISAIALVVLPFALGINNFVVGAMLACFVAAVLNAHAAWFKAWPTDVTHASIDAAKRQLAEAGEAEQRLGSILGEVTYAVLCLGDGALTGTALAERLGQSALTPAMARIIGLIVAVVLASALFALVKAAAREATKSESRQKIRNLQQANPVQAAAMETRIGAALNYTYGSHDNVIWARVSLVCLVGFMAVSQFALRLGAFGVEDAGMLDNFANLFAAIFVALLVVFTARAMYSTERRHVFLDEDSRFSKLILGKFPDHGSIDKHRSRHELRWRRVAHNTVRCFAGKFKAIRSDRNLAKAHPIPML